MKKGIAKWLIAALLTASALTQVGVLPPLVGQLAGALRPAAAVLAE